MSTIFLALNAWREILARVFEGFAAQTNVSPEWLVNPATRPNPDVEQDAGALALTETISALTTGTFLTVTGTLKHDERVKLGGVEIKVERLDIAASALPETPIAADSALDKRMDWRFLDLRQRRNNRGNQRIALNLVIKEMFFAIALQ